MTKSRFFIVVDVDPGALAVHLMEPTDRYSEVEEMALYCKACLRSPGIRPVTVYESLEDLNADHVLDALAGTSKQETP